MDPRVMSWSSQKPLNCELKDDSIVVNDDLFISFQRTVRVPDNQQTSFLPPDCGRFPLKAVSKYATKFCLEMFAKAGVFLPMYRRWYLLYTSD
jgi:hypothetical protein